MSFKPALPRILVLDDLLGRRLRGRPNEERANFCGQFLLRDITGDESPSAAHQARILAPVAEAVFHRGQTPTCASIGDTVENDLQGTLNFVGSGWRPAEGHVWAMVLLDLCFYTGPVTDASDCVAMGMPEGSPLDSEPASYFGLRVLEALHERFPELPVVVLSSMPQKDVTLRYSLHGARGFLSKDEEGGQDMLRGYLWREGLLPDHSGFIIGTSLPLLVALRRARRHSSARRNVLLRAERGAGKELFARFIHDNSSSSDAPFIAVNCATMAPALFASELFGIKARTATGVEPREGLIVQADGGDLFFDEVADMPAEIQAGVLRVLEDRQVRAVGSSMSRSVDVRFVSATNVDIEARVASGSVREDLIERLSEGGTVFLPPLRERRSDIPLLAEAFVREAERSVRSAEQRVIEPEVVVMLQDHDWPGNVRGLRTCIFNAVSEYPGVEHLVPVHLELPTGPGVGDPMRRPEDHGVSIPRGATTDRDTEPLGKLRAEMQACSFEDLSEEELGGRLAELRAASVRLMSRYLSAALVACRRPTDASLKIHPGMKFATGDPKLTAYQAADLIKRVLSFDTDLLEALLDDPILREAYDAAVKLRGARRK